MYDAAPPRPRTTAIQRSRGGCRPCRVIRRKCDERKPGCLRCEKGGRQCWYRGLDSFQWRDSNEWAALKVKKARGERASPSPADASSTFTLEESVVRRIEYDDKFSFQSRPDDPGTAPRSPPWALLDSSSATTASSSPSPSGSYWMDWTPIYPGLLPTQLPHSERKYLDHFSSHVLDILPKSLEPMHPFIHGAETVLYAAMDTSAANLARLHGKYVPSGSKNLAWAPEPGHKIKAFFFAGKALSLAASHGKTDPEILLSTQVLLSLVEAELGTFEGLRRYLNSLRCFFVSQSRDELVGSQGCRELVNAALDYHLLQSLLSGVSWSSRVSSDRHRGSSSFFQVGCSSLFQVLGWEAVTVDARLGLLQAMRHSKMHPNPLRERQIRRVASMCAPQGLQGPLQELALATIDLELEQTRLELKRLFTAFSRCQPPVELLGSASSLRFRTHEDAMTAADFVFCRILCDEALVDSLSLPSGSPEMPDLTHIGTWVATLIQIASGMDMAACGVRNVFRPGILPMLEACSYPCRSAALLDFLEDFYKRTPVQGQNFEQLSSPSSAAFPSIGLIRSQWELGRTILVMQPLDGHVDPGSAINTVEEWTSCSIHGLEANGDFFDGVFQVQEPRSEQIQ